MVRAQQTDVDVTAVSVVIQAVLNVMNAIMGSGILALPSVMAENGVVLYICLQVAMMIVVDFSLHLLVQASFATDVFDYESLGANRIPNRGTRLQRHRTVQRAQTPPPSPSRQLHAHHCRRGGDGPVGKADCHPLHHCAEHGRLPQLLHRDRRHRAPTHEGVCRAPGCGLPLPTTSGTAHPGARAGAVSGASGGFAAVGGS